MVEEEVDEMEGRERGGSLVHPQDGSVCGVPFNVRAEYVAVISVSRNRYP